MKVDIQLPTNHEEETVTQSVSNIHHGSATISGSEGHDSNSHVSKVDSEDVAFVRCGGYPFYWEQHGSEVKVYV